MSEVKETLETALAEMKRRGRCRTVLLEARSGKCCALGAVGLAMGIDPYVLSKGTYDAYDPIHDSPAVQALGDQLPEDPMDVEDGYKEAPHRKVFMFNDNHRVQDEDVYDLFERAIASC